MHHDVVYCCGDGAAGGASVGTLVVAVSGFYLGNSPPACANAAGAAANRDQCVADPTRDPGVAGALVVTSIDPPVGEPAQTPDRFTD